MRLLEELFFIDHKEHKIVYAPWSRTAFLVNKDGEKFLSNYRQGDKIQITPENKDFVDRLADEGVFGDEKKIRKFHKKTYTGPTNYALFLTSNCNLNCVYCYASGGDNVVYMPWRIAQVSIDYFVKNTIKLKRDHMRVALHGGGEQTLAFNMMKKIVAYTKYECEQNKIKSKFGLTTNGIIASNKIDFICSEIEHLQISMDGPEDIQNAQRPLSNGKESYNRVYDTLKKLDEKGKKYEIHVTLLRENFYRIPEIIDFFHSNFKSSRVTMTPANYSGRIGKEGRLKWSKTSLMKLVDSVRDGKDLAKRYGMEFYCNLDCANKFKDYHCGALGSDNFLVNTDGYVSSCLEVTSRESPAADEFTYGRYDFQKKRFVINKDVIDKLVERHVENLQYCKDCFCKHHCAGGCPVKSIYVKKDLCYVVGEWCDVIRELAKRDIIDSLDT